MVAVAENTSSQACNPLPFGIPSLDELLAIGSRHEAQACLYSKTSLAIVGQDGTGKSVFGLHLASAYLNQVWKVSRDASDPEAAATPSRACVLYASSDLSYSSANKVWETFGLGIPNLRYTPFISHAERNERLKAELRCLLPRASGGAVGGSDYCEITLQHLVPRGPGWKCDSGGCSVPDFLAYPRGQGRMPAVGLLDLTEYSAGDDWMYLCRLVANQPVARRGDPRNLLIVDSIEGFETLIGERNSFGERMSRRARIAQLVRAAGDDWHLVFLVEEPSPGHRHPEEYVADSVIRLRRSSKGETVRRWVEIEKSRGRAYSPGEHPFEIRSGLGTSTGEWENPDDPMAVPHPLVKDRLATRIKPPGQFGYVQVFPSLGHLSKQFAERVISETQAINHGSRLDGYAAFGIENLDNLLGTEGSVSTATDGEGDRREGLAWGSINSLVGKGGTARKALSKQFLFNSFASFPEIFHCVLNIARSWRPGSLPSQEDFGRWLSDRMKEALDAQDGNQSAEHRLPASTRAALRTRFVAPFEGGADDDESRETRQAHAGTAGWLAQAGPPDLRDSFRADAAPRMNRWDERLYYVLENAPADRPAGRGSPLSNKALGLAFAILRAPLGAIDPVVLITTQDVSRKLLVERLVQAHSAALLGICESVLGIALRDDDREPVLWHFRNILERYFIVRRLEHADISAPQLWHVIQQCVASAKGALGLPVASATEIEEQPSVGAIRLVIGDLHLMRQMYPDFARETLFMPMLAFWLQRQNITTLLINSPDDADAANSTGYSQLSMLTARLIRTWEVDFFGERRVAISVTPPTADRSHALVRELRRLEGRMNSADPRLPLLDVDPHFELYSGIGIERGEPKPVPLRISLWRDTAAFDEYARDEEHMLSRMFTAVSREDTVLESLKSEAYESIKDFVHLPDETRLDHTHVFAVNGYWALNRENSLEHQSRYLNAPFDRREKPDVFELYRARHQGESDRPPRCRLSAHEQIAQDGKVLYRARIPKDSTSIDRVPFTWDFAFLLLDERFSQHAVAMRLRKPGESGGKPPAGGAPGWREFFGACVSHAAQVREVAGRRILPFSQGRNNKSVLLGLLLEVWLSEVLDDAGRPGSAATTGWRQFALDNLKFLSTEYFQGMEGPGKPQGSVLEQLLGRVDCGGVSISRLLRQSVEARWQAASGSITTTQTSSNPLDKTFVPQLLRAWALLHAAYCHQNGGDGLVSAVEQGRTELLDSAAVRHYYTTACEVQRAAKLRADLSEQSVPAYGRVARLPGRFSTRGDWFLAVAKGSRSVRLADRALDILSSKRANRSRLERGLGLPTRPLLDRRASYAGIRTALMTIDNGIARGIYYDNLVQLGASFLYQSSDVNDGKAHCPLQQDDGSFNELGDEDYFWLFRSGFSNFDRFEPLLRNWVYRLATWSDRLAQEASSKRVLGFELYDMLVNNEAPSEEDKARLFQTFDEFGARLENGLLTEIQECVGRYDDTGGPVPKTDTPAST